MKKLLVWRDTSAGEDISKSTFICNCTISSVYYQEICFRRWKIDVTIVASTSVTKYLIVSLVYFSDSTWQKSSMYPGTPPVFAMHSRKNIRREPMGYLMIDVLVTDRFNAYSICFMG